MFHRPPAHARRRIQTRRSSAWLTLPAVARAYVSAITACGLFVLARAVPAALEQDPGLFATFLLLSVVASFAKIAVPVPRSVSTLTVCYIIDYTAFLLLGAQAAAVTAAAGAWSQCTFKARHRNPLHQTLFSVALLALTVQIAAVTYKSCGGQRLQWGAAVPIEALVAAATMFFLVNTLFVAVAVGLATRQSILNVWTENFLWSWPGYMVGAGVAAAAAAAIERSGAWLLPFVAIPLALTWHNFKSHIRRVNESQTDALTSLPNSRFLTSHADDEIARARRDGTPLSVIVADLDGFKSINDTYGHAAGDAALRHVGATLAANIGDRGICARYGGDEFVCILPGCGLHEAHRIQTELQTSIEHLACCASDDTPVRFTISAGAATVGVDGWTFDELLAAADVRMFREKGGRWGGEPSGTPRVRGSVADVRTGGARLA